MPDEHDAYWFPAKRYGWGWGLPVAWQGWVVLGLYFVATISAGIWLRPHVHPLMFYGSVGAATVLLIVVCLLKGEPPGER
jgi:hypothetical protein